MIALIAAARRKPRRLNSILSLTLDGARLEGVVLRRTNGSMQAQQTFSVQLSLDPLTASAELVARELRNHLDANGIRERDCILGLPLKWALTTHVDMTNVPESDLPTFLQLEAERGFPCDAETLQIGSSRYSAGQGKEHALLIGIPRSHLVTMEAILRAARLRPVSFTLPLNLPLGGNAGTLSLFIGDNHVSLEVTFGSGLAALRVIEGALENENGRTQLQAGAVVREVRITLGQFPAEIREKLTNIQVFGPRDLSQQLADELELRLDAAGLQVEAVHRYIPKQFGPSLPADTAVSPALTIGARLLGGQGSPLEFLPPKVSAWQRFITRRASGRLRLAAILAILLLAAVLGAFGMQQWQLTSLRTEWARMAGKTKQLETVQERVRQYRPWYDESLSTMHVLKRLTEAFPEDGAVSAKTVEIRANRTVTCTGTARDNPSLLKTLDRLRASGVAGDLKVDQIRGKAPLQFTFNFQWNEGGSGEK